jgi:hypothetical protein
MTMEISVKQKEAIENDSKDFLNCIHSINDIVAQVSLKAESLLKRFLISFLNPFSLSLQTSFSLKHFFLNFLYG